MRQWSHFFELGKTHTWFEVDLLWPESVGLSVDTRKCWGPKTSKKCFLSFSHSFWHSYKKQLTFQASHLTVLQAKLTGDSHVDSTFLPEVNPDSVDVLVSNPPYVLRKDLKALAPDIKIYEDLRALDGGSDGLDVIECIIKWSSKVLKPGGKIFLETDPCHHILLPEMLEKLSNQIPYFKIQMESVTKDFSSKDRFITLIKGTWSSKVLINFTPESS